jgi:hypothetical protein
LCFAIRCRDFANPDNSYQRAGIDFMLRRETNDIPTSQNLWVRKTSTYGMP